MRKKGDSYSDKLIFVNNKKKKKSEITPTHRGQANQENVAQSFLVINTSIKVCGCSRVFTFEGRGGRGTRLKFDDLD